MAAQPTYIDRTVDIVSDFCFSYRIKLEDGEELLKLSYHERDTGDKAIVEITFNTDHAKIVAEEILKMIKE